MKKIILIGILCVMPILFFSAMPSVKAATMTEIQAQITSLIAQIKVLQQQLANSHSSVYLNSPNGGEQFHKGGEITVKWNSSGTDYVDIELLDYGRSQKDGSVPFVSHLVSNYSAWMGTYTWKIPSDWITGSLFKIKISSSNPLGNDISDNYFTIDSGSNVPSITVTSPNGGESWNIGETHTVTWSASNLPANSYVYIGINGDNVTSSISGGQIAYVLASSGAYSWTVPGALGGVNLIGKKFEFYVTLAPSKVGDASSVGDTSANYFSIGIPVSTPASLELSPTIKIISPNGGEMLSPGQKYTISWQATNVDKIRIYLYNYVTDSSWIMDNIAIDVPASQGFYSWTVMPANNSLAKSGRYKIFISNTSTVTDYSNDYFTIYSPLGIIENSLANMAQIIRQIFQMIGK